DVGHVTQREDVHAIVVRGAAAWPAAASTAAANRRLRPSTASSSAARRKWKWNRDRRSRRRTERRLALAVDADCVHQQLALTDHLFDFADRGAARRVVAVRDHQQGFLAVLATPAQRNGFGD